MWGLNQAENQGNRAKELEAGRLWLNHLRLTRRGLEA